MSIKIPNQIMCLRTLWSFLFHYKAELNSKSDLKFSSLEANNWEIGKKIATLFDDPNPFLTND